MPNEILQKLKNLGSAKKFTPNQISRDGSQDPNATSKDDDSPYKNALGKIKRFSLKNDGEDDFASPKSAPKVFKTQKISKKVPAKSSRSKTSKKKPTNTILKYTKDNFKDLDVNPEHLQMALALSKSTFAQENPDREQEVNEVVFLSPERIPKVTSFLEKYGFKSVKQQLHPDFIRDHLEEAKKRKNSKFRFVTPTLYTRSAEERESLINTKVSLIISQQYKSSSTKSTSNETHSVELKKYLSGNTCWNINCVQQSNDFILPSLQLSPPTSTVGCLLKSWDEIPGREKTPEKKLVNPADSLSTSIKINDTTKKTEEIPYNTTNISESREEKGSERVGTPKSDQRRSYCFSPDLFESDNDSFIANSLPRDSQLSSCSTDMKNVSNSSSASSKSVHGMKTSSQSIESSKTEGNGYIEENLNNSERSSTTAVKENSRRLSELSSVEEIEKDNKGIECFESFYDESEGFKDLGRCSVVDLTQSSSEEDEPERNHDELNYEGKDMNDTELEDVQIRVTENFEKMYELPKERLLLTTQRSSFDSGNISLEYNHTKSLNVTDYVLEMLNSQEPKRQENESPSQSLSTCSQESIVIESDEELNYSSRFSAHCKNDNLYDLDCFDDCFETNAEKEETDTIESRNKTVNDETEQLTDQHSDIPLSKTKKQKSPVISPNTDLHNSIIEANPGISTPKNVKTSYPLSTPNNNLVIKIQNVTPMADYDLMDTPTIKQELDKFGIKPLKRRRGVELLRYIYETTHPVVELEQTEVTVKKRKLDTTFEDGDGGTIKIVGAEIIDNENDELLFERRFSKKIHSCRIPLQIAWYNFLCCNSTLKENILLYEPIQLEVIHSMLKEQSGCNFHMEELITFLDRKCITFRTNQWQKSRKKTSKAKS